MKRPEPYGWKIGSDNGVEDVTRRVLRGDIRNAAATEEQEKAARRKGGMNRLHMNQKPIQDSFLAVYGEFLANSHKTIRNLISLLSRGLEGDEAPPEQRL